MTAQEKKDLDEIISILKRNLKSTCFNSKLSNEDVLRLPTMSYILDQIITDFETIVSIQDHYLEKVYPHDASLDVHKHQTVFFSYLILILFKYMEFYEMYKAPLNLLITDNQPKDIYNELKKLNIRNFRNTFIGHIIDKKTKQPISLKDISSFFDNIEKEHKSLYAFYMKIHSYDFDKKPLIDILKNYQKIIQDEVDKIKKFIASNNR